MEKKTKDLVIVDQLYRGNHLSNEEQQQAIKIIYGLVQAFNTSNSINTKLNLKIIKP